MGLIAVGVVAALAGAGMSAMGAMSQAKAQKDVALYNAQIAQRNATISRQQASRDAAAHNRNARRQIGAMRAAYGASGIAMEGSPLDVLASSAAEAKLDEMNIKYKGELKAIGFQDEATLERFSGENAMKQGRMEAASAIIGGIGSAINMGAKGASMGAGGVA
ncbi:virion core protein, T7 gp14 family [Nitrosovibrio sp. Nv4]|uniref:virion core protein, T7 gp14 family n=1 Tax=Nitrosovibrio sp. Nv4 TaxID=1945880 RepID=UPI000BD5E65F|nr:hypothetical protein [Nitrosovibrio sp. Nv4]SOD41313.1 hypothetical protein SAMN06298226_1608 [Nitrosovibrio sp. Nv4]